MPDLRLNRFPFLFIVTRCGPTGATSARKRELLNFIDSVAMLTGPRVTRILTEVWLDGLAPMDCAPDLNERN